ncbi:MAG: FtsX-like permease family protein [Burkholderiaceae bacterium]
MSMLSRKLFRDLRRLWAQALAVALVMACGVATLVTAVGTSRSLEQTRDTFYERQRFASVFAGATRAPEHLARRLQAIAGVSAVQTRIVESMILDMPGMREPAGGLIVSLPDEGQAAVNRLFLREGRLPANRRGEAAVLARFADAHRLRIGDRVQAITHGRRIALHITGIVFSPEYVFAMAPGDLVPDPRRFGVFFAAQGQLAGIFDMRQAFNDVALSTRRDADLDAVRRQVDSILAPYGGRDAVTRADQMSHAFLDSELTQLRGMARVLPPVFVVVAAFLVNLILGRLVTLEREQIGLLKAVGYGDIALALHYLQFALVIVVFGAIIGALAGQWLGVALVRLYGEYYAFPWLLFRPSADLLAIATGICLLAAVAGAGRAIIRVGRLSPAAAMQPPAPTRYRTLGGRRPLSTPWISALERMALRHMIRWPLRSALTSVGVALSVALLVTALFSIDSVTFMIDSIFSRSERQDATLVFGQALSPRAAREAARLPGVLLAEPFRSSAVRLRHGHRSRKLAINGLPLDGRLGRTLDRDIEPVAPPASGLMISARLAKLLGVRIGDRIEVVLLEQDHRVSEVTVTDLAQNLIGLTAVMSLPALDELLRTGPRVNGVRLLVDDDRLDDLYAAVKKTPALAAVSLHGVARAQFRRTIEENILTMTIVYIVLAVVITFGVVYNTARIQLSERARELASLRVLGFQRNEVARVLMLELSGLILIAQPLGWAIGYGLAAAMVEGLATDLFRIPLIVTPATFAQASAVVLLAAGGSAWLVRRRVDHLDLIRVLKSRE